MHGLARSARFATFVGFGAAIALGAISTAQADTFTLRIGSGHPSAPVAYVDQMEHFFVPEVTRRVEERTGHKVRFIEAYAGTVAKVHETLEAVEKGVLDIGGWCQCFEPTKALPLNISYFLPFTTPDVRRQVEVTRQLINEFPEMYDYLEKDYNQQLLAISGFDNYGLGTTFPWEKTSELNGHKLLGAGPNLPWISGSGAVPVTTTLPTAYNQLETGVGEGIIMFPGSYFGFKFHEPAPYYKVTNFGAMSQVSLTMNMDTRAKLPTEVVAIIDEVAKEWETVSSDVAHSKEAAGLEALRAAGAEVSEMTREAQVEWAASMIDWPNERTQALNEFGINGTEIMKRYISLLEEAGHDFPVDYPIN